MREIQFEGNRDGNSGKELKGSQQQSVNCHGTIQVLFLLGCLPTADTLASLTMHVPATPHISMDLLATGKCRQITIFLPGLPSLFNTRLTQCNREHKLRVSQMAEALWRVPIR